MFWSVMYMGVPNKMLEQEQFVGWMTAFHNLITRPVPQASRPSELLSGRVITPETQIFLEIFFPVGLSGLKSS